MQAELQHRHSRCETLASPRKLYDNLLVHISQKFDNREKVLFEFSFRHDMPMRVLETQEPLKWFRCLEQQMRLSWNDVNCLVDFLEEASLEELLTVARDYQARITVITFFQKHLQAKFPELRLSNKLQEKWYSKQNLPKNYLRRCRKLLRGRGVNRDLSINCVRSLFSKGVVLLVKSCSPVLPSSNGLQSVCLKLLYLADLFYHRFKAMIIDNDEMLNIKLLPSGKFFAHDNRILTRKSVNPKVRPDHEMPAVQQEISHRRSSREVFEFHVRLCFTFLLGLFSSLQGDVLRSIKIHQI
ncbi:uncharacterized protein LOC114527842 [Dendronephthya gigantea]|uniref:uncharacterized protein LOC114527842 n=1 Tax=Dendronephthya gigantea TaxID=151771 RepID=UPI00106CFA58|nr:uncharacterized protein LOC114527842 [Dendronephthya gigantea]